MGFGKAVSREFEELTKESHSRKTLTVTGACFLCLCFCVYCVSVSRSLVLTGCTWLTVFSISSLCADLVSTSVRNKVPTTAMSFGLARAPVLAVFASTVLAQLAALFIIKESVERLIEKEDDDRTSKLFPGTVSAVIAQMLAIYSVRNEPVQHVVTAAQSSWLQEHAADISRSICKIMPGLTRLLLPRLNPLSLLCLFGACSSFLTHYLLVHKQIWWADAAGAVCLSFAILGSMWPLSKYTGRVLLQTTPPHLVAQLDRCLNEASTLDGVLELTGAHFWQLDLSKMAGTVVVRVRRDADEQLVLARVTEKLCSVVNYLTVQVTKDADWQTLSGGHADHGHASNTAHGRSEKCSKSGATKPFMINKQSARISLSVTYLTVSVSPQLVGHSHGGTTDSCTDSHDAGGHGHSHGGGGHGHSHAEQKGHGHGHSHAEKKGHGHSHDSHVTHH